MIVVLWRDTDVTTHSTSIDVMEIIVKTARTSNDDLEKTSFAVCRENTGKVAVFSAKPWDHEAGRA